MTCERGSCGNLPTTTVEGTLNCEHACSTGAKHTGIVTARHVVCKGGCAGTAFTADTLTSKDGTFHHARHKRLWGEGNEVLHNVKRTKWCGERACECPPGQCTIGDHPGANLVCTGSCTCQQGYICDINCNTRHPVHPACRSGTKFMGIFRDAVCKSHVWHNGGTCSGASGFNLQGKLTCENSCRNIAGEIHANEIVCTGGGCSNLPSTTVAGTINCGPGSCGTSPGKGGPIKSKHIICATKACTNLALQADTLTCGARSCGAIKSLEFTGSNPVLQCKHDCNALQTWLIANDFMQTLSKMSSSVTAFKLDGNLKPWPPSQCKLQPGFANEQVSAGWWYCPHSKDIKTRCAASPTACAGAKHTREQRSSNEVHHVTNISDWVKLPISLSLLKTKVYDFVNPITGLTEKTSEIPLRVMEDYGLGYQPLATKTTGVLRTISGTLYVTYTRSITYKLCVTCDL